MSKAGREIIQGLEKAIKYTRGEKTSARTHVVNVPLTDVREARAHLGMSQEIFAESFGISVGTLRGWEQGRRVPDGPARALLAIIAKEPKAAKRALKEYAEESGV